LARTRPGPEPRIHLSKWHRDEERTDVTIHDVNLQQQQAELFFEQLFHQLAAKERIEVRHKLPGKGHPMRRNFYADSKEAARNAILLGRREEVYVGAAPRRGEDGTKAGVSRLLAIWADLDAKGGHTQESRTEQLLELPLQPSIMVWTGGGWHAYFLLEKPADGPEELQRAELIMRRLAAGLRSDPVHDRSRILRVPGTYNWKYGEPRPVIMERFDPDLRYRLEKLEEIAGALAGDVFDDVDKADTVSRDVLRGPIRDGRRNVTLASVAGSLRDRGLDAETICIVLLEVNQRRCEPPLAEAEVVGIGRSIGRYPPGSPRYRKSSAIRVYTNRKASS
jgi:Primase C terminal 1 (PriCT-1)